MALTPQEREILASIEKELTEKDPRLAATPDTVSLRLGAGTRRPVFVCHVLLLVAALAVLAALSPILSQLGVFALAACTTALIVPWLMGAARAVRTRGGARAEGGSPRGGGADGTSGQEPAVSS